MTNTTWSLFTDGIIYRASLVQAGLYNEFKTNMTSY